MRYEIDTRQTVTNTPPQWLYGYLRRDVGLTRQTKNRYWQTVVSSDIAASLWNKLTHDMTTVPLTELQLNWYPVHYAHVINTAPLTDYDKSLLHFKLYKHLLRHERRIAS